MKDTKQLSPEMFANLIGANKSLRFVINKKYKSSKSVKEWREICVKDKLLDSVPEILTNKVDKLEEK